MHRVLDKLEARLRAGRDRLVGIDDEGIGERGDRLELFGHLLGAELDHLKLGIVGVAGEIVELVTQHIAVARQLILRDQRAVALDLEDVGKNPGKSLEFAGQAGDLIEERRIGGALHRLIDGVFQTGFGGQRRGGVVLFPGHDVIARQRPVRNQLAVDIARQIGLRHAVPVGRDTGGHAFETQIGDAHAGHRDDQHDSKAENDLAAETQGRKL